MKTRNLLFSFLAFFTVSLINPKINAANPEVVDGVATFHSDTTIGRKFLVPDAWDKIVIEENVTLIGSFFMPTREKAIEIMGKSRETSIIKGDGTRPTDDGIKGRTYSGIRCNKSPDVYIHDLRSLDPMKFHISAGFGNVKVERCDLIETRGKHTTDGVHGGRNTTQVIDCYIDTHDDALYISECFLVKNCTIVNNHNGAPFQVGWGKDIGVDSCRIENCVVIDNHKGPQSKYYMGVVGWANRQGTRQNVMNITFVNFKRELAPGAMKSPMYQFGRGSKGIENCTINVEGYCDEDDVAEFYVSKNCDLNIACETCEIPGNTTISSTESDCSNPDGSITFTFTDDPNQSKIKFSIDGGSNYTEANDDAGSYTFDGLEAGDYSCWVKWGNDSCIKFLENKTVTCTGNFAIPGKVEAEKYASMEGVQTEPTTDEGKGLNVGYFDQGDWLDYNVDVQTSGDYTAEFRVASQSNNIRFDLKKENTVLASINTSTTGGWQTWKTVSEPVTLTEGAQTLRIQSAGGGWNINWMNFNLESVSKDYTDMQQSIRVYPSHASNTINVSLPNDLDAEYSIYSTTGSIVAQGAINDRETFIDISSLNSGMYIVLVQSGSSVLSTKISIGR
ncbi:MAG: carbohydrate-binding protein [Bacteroidales bacterium]|nr:carbohydrate-binding protein [Bacteroidales bacterium]